MLDFFRSLSGPVTMHLELTEACPERCRHCYNFVRDPHYRPKSITKKNIKRFLEDFNTSGGFHVILTGGEPLIAFDKLLYATEVAKSLGLSVSLNSNLMLAKDNPMKRLKAAGIDHILTTLFSHDSKTHDFIASRSGSHHAILKGIKVAKNAGIRVSVNMIITNVNDKHVYQTGKFLHDIGHEKFIANRMIPSKMNSVSLKEEF
jgi:MoaA/NifB/PqqE/SkfB family radical SAM enzyme